VLERGYAIVTTESAEVVQSSAALAIGQPLRIRFAQGGAQASVIAKD
jgi:exonuclease VII large subunit